MIEHDPNLITASLMIHDMCSKSGIRGKLIWLLWTSSDWIFNTMNNVGSEYLSRRDKMTLQRVAYGCYEKELDEMKKKKGLFQNGGQGFVRAEVLE